MSQHKNGGHTNPFPEWMSPRQKAACFWSALVIVWMFLLLLIGAVMNWAGSC